MHLVRILSLSNLLSASLRIHYLILPNRSPNFLGIDLSRQIAFDSSVPVNTVPHNEVSKLLHFFKHRISPI
jgi:hypothetical protein